MKIQLLHDNDSVISTWHHVKTDSSGVGILAIDVDGNPCTLYSSLMDAVREQEKRSDNSDSR